MPRRKWRHTRLPFWHWLLHVVAWGVLLTFIFAVIASSIYSVIKVLQ